MDVARSVILSKKLMQLRKLAPGACRFGRCQAVKRRNGCNTPERSIVPPNNVKARAGVLGGREVANGAEEGRGQGVGAWQGKRKGRAGASLVAWEPAERAGGRATLLAAPFKEGTALVPCLGTAVATGTARDPPPISPRLRLQRHRPGPGECEGASYMPAHDEHHHHSPIPTATNMTAAAPADYPSDGRSDWLTN
ncbi:hypothetical protein GGP41_003377 [Bipolaris sorokiniana]|uniref:Uncharacterized protein n=1 Tax=Cochliobolus sativus TaxID=45130 RepID=A0A8H5ZF96_COCSA|nr:hypothetical protein GGP41_003377 [Bipolaris sorokiniana]